MANTCSCVLSMHTFQSSGRGFSLPRLASVVRLPQLHLHHDRVHVEWHWATLQHHHGGCFLIASQRSSSQMKLVSEQSSALFFSQWRYLQKQRQNSPSFLSSYISLVLLRSSFPGIWQANFVVLGNIGILFHSTSKVWFWHKLGLVKATRTFLKLHLQGKADRHHPTRLRSVSLKWLEKEVPWSKLLRKESLQEWEKDLLQKLQKAVEIYTLFTDCFPWIISSLTCSHTLRRVFRMLKDLGDIWTNLAISIIFWSGNFSLILKAVPAMMCVFPLPVSPCNTKGTLQLPLM